MSLYSSRYNQGSSVVRPQYQNTGSNARRPQHVKQSNGTQQSVQRYNMIPSRSIHLEELPQTFPDSKGSLSELKNQLAHQPSSRHSPRVIIELRVGVVAAVCRSRKSSHLTVSRQNPYLISSIFFYFGPVRVGPAEKWIHHPKVVSRGPLRIWTQNLEALALTLHCTRRKKYIKLGHFYTPT